MESIILVEDNEIILNGLAFSLEQEGYNIIKANNAKEALSKLNASINLVILDITLPDGNGFDICKKIKEEMDIPIIFLTAKDEEKDVVQGLELGADDYVIKPFRLKELISRIRTILRRYNSESEKSNIIKIKNVTVNIDKSIVYKNGEEVELTALEFGLPLGVILCWLINKAFGNGIEFVFRLPWDSIIISIIAVYAVVFITMIYSSRKMKKENIIEALRDDNI